jgi:Tol biopolymer transport system component
MPYGQEGRQAVVYQVVAENGDRRALKVFKPRFRAPALVGLTDQLAAFADLPGLAVCRRAVLTPRRHTELLRQHPDLTYAVLMPWIEGPTWMEILLEKQPLTPEQSLCLARSLAEILAGMEERGLAHCDLSGPNVLLPLLTPFPSQGEGWGGGEGVALVDVEQMFAPGLNRPQILVSGSYGYAHKTAPDGLWTINADRFAGAILLAELLGWRDPRLREAAWGESYFDPAELQQDGARYRTLQAVLRERWGAALAGLCERAWQSETLADCATFGEWLVALPEKVPAGLVVAQSAPKPWGAKSTAEPKTVNSLLAVARQLEVAGNPGGALAAYRQALAHAPAGSVQAAETIAHVKELEAHVAQAAVPASYAAPATPGLGPHQIPGEYSEEGEVRLKEVPPAVLRGDRRHRVSPWAVAGLVLAAALVLLVVGWVAVYRGNQARKSAVGATASSLTRQVGTSVKSTSDSVQTALAGAIARSTSEAVQVEQTRVVIARAVTASAQTVTAADAIRAIQAQETVQAAAVLASTSATSAANATVAASATAASLARQEATRVDATRVAAEGTAVALAATATQLARDVSAAQTRSAEATGEARSAAAAARSTADAYATIVARQTADAVRMDVSQALAFVSERTGSSQIFIAHLRTGALRQLTSSGRNTMPMWASDNQTIYHLSDRDGSQALYRTDIQSGQSQRVSSAGAGSLAISAGGRTAYANGSQISVNGSVVANESGRVEISGWSHTGDLLIYLVDQGGNLALGAYTPGQGARRLRGPEPGLRNPAPASDGSSVAYVTNVETGTSRMHLYTFGSGNDAAITPPSSWVQVPAWIPGRSLISFITQKTSSRWDLMSTRTDGGDWQTIASGIEPGSYYAWSPGGDRLAYVTADWEVVVMAYPGGSAANISRHGAKDYGPAWPW